MPEYSGICFRNFESIAMKGIIKAYSTCVNAGFIISNGRNYQFARRDWVSLVLPVNDQSVEFNGETGRACNIVAA